MPQKNIRTGIVPPNMMRGTPNKTPETVEEIKILSAGSISKDPLKKKLIENNGTRMTAKILANVILLNAKNKEIVNNERQTTI